MTDLREQLLEQLDYFIETVMLKHDMCMDDAACSCGARNNMDGDVLHGHRLGVLSEGIEEIFEGIRMTRRRIPRTADPELRITLDAANCGTEANAKAHRRRGESPCTPCRLAENAASSRRYYARQGGPKYRNQRHCRHCGGYLPENPSSCKRCKNEELQ